jgi:hypothetical protein
MVFNGAEEREYVCVCVCVDSADSAQVLVPVTCEGANKFSSFKKKKKGHRLATGANIPGYCFCGQQTVQKY